MRTSVSPVAPALLFVDDQQRERARRERDRIASLGNAPTWLARAAVELATALPGNPLVPEALHLAVRASRQGMTDEQTGKWSKAAFEFLHSRYPKSGWAAKTPYWFK